MDSSVVVCSGCCCGRVDRGHPEVPIDYLNEAWEIYQLGEKVDFTISGCLGPCSMHNVSKLITKNEEIWIGELDRREHYEAIVSWAIEISQSGSDVKIPEILESQIFTPDSKYLA